VTSKSRPARYTLDGKRLERPDNLSSDEFRRLVAWMRSVPRKIPELAFTAGILRDFASAFDFVIRRADEQQESPMTTRKTYPSVPALLNGLGTAPLPGERVRDRHGEIRCMESAEGWVMCRRKGAMPFLIPVAEWRKLREQEPSP
jgi:hypothetical protein